MKHAVLDYSISIGGGRGKRIVFRPFKYFKPVNMIQYYLLQSTEEDEWRGCVWS